MFSTIMYTIVLQFFTLLQGIILARILGPEDRGTLYSTIFYANLFAMIFLCGVNTNLARISISGSCIKRNFNNFIFSSIFLSILCVLIYLFFLNYKDISDFNYYLFAVVIPVLIPSQLLLSIMQGSGDLKIYNLSRIMFFPFYTLLLSILFLIFKVDINSALYSYIISLVLVLIWRVGFYIRILKKASKNEERETFKDFLLFLRVSLPFWLSSLFPILAVQIDKIIVIENFDPSEVSFYIVSFTLASIVNTVSTSISTFVFSRLNKANYHKVESEILWGIKINIYLSVLLYVFICVFGKWIIECVYGHEFSVSYIYIPFLSLAVIFGGVSSIIDNSIRSLGNATLGVRNRIVLFFAMYFIAKIFPLSLMQFCYLYLTIEFLSVTQYLLVLKKIIPNFKIYKIMSISLYEIERVISFLGMDNKGR